MQYEFKQPTRRCKLVMVYLNNDHIIILELYSVWIYTMLICMQIHNWIKYMMYNVNYLCQALSTIQLFVVLVIVL